MKNLYLISLFILSACGGCTDTHTQETTDIVEQEFEDISLENDLYLSSSFASQFTYANKSLAQWVFS